ncbi:hypothetical protein BF49_5622 [Bradyrhizobium sp.]|uniref:hypothetical protein n=1 Tax=Bradyrhizobium sp. TaxID=376 RepID=UPI0007C1EB33|nr:hypothetical protein [Bradyrhizobium sp.]CUT14542.1 hypothetical protein BF49_5622 [Bradyrhizobium sp.]
MIHRKRVDYRDPGADRAAGIKPDNRPIWQVLGCATERQYDDLMNEFDEAMYQEFEKDARLAAMPIAGHA